ncbi:MAG: hypothetical protein ACK4K8_14175 [Pannonibacter sp.]
MPRQSRDPEEASLRPLGIAIALGLILAVIISLTGPDSAASARPDRQVPPPQDSSR